MIVVVESGAFVAVVVAVVVGGGIGVGVVGIFIDGDISSVSFLELELSPVTETSVVLSSISLF